MINNISILGCGWLGLPLGKALVEEGYVIRGSTTSKEKLALIESKGIDAYLLQVGEDIIGERQEDFFHTDLIIINIPPGSRRDPNVEQNYPNKIKLILEKVNQSTIQQIIFVSTTSVYGNINDEITEWSPTVPNTNSGRAVLKAEKILAEYSNIRTTILRMAGLVGGERKAGRFLAGKKEVPNANAPVNLVHLEDCIGVIRAILRQGVWGQVFNVCADEHPSKALFYTQQAQKQGFEPPTFMDTFGENAKIVSNTKLKQYLNYGFIHPDPMGF